MNRVPAANPVRRIVGHTINTHAAAQQAARELDIDVSSGGAMEEEIVIREAQVRDIADIVRHRRRMYEDMGERDARALEAMQASTRAFLEKAIPAGIFRGWLAQTRGGRVMAGGGMMIVPCPPTQSPAGRGS